jgi:four helix bundle protein
MQCTAAEDACLGCLKSVSQNKTTGIFGADLRRMPGVKRCSDLICYQLAVEIRREVLRFTRRADVRKDFKFVSQICDAARGGTRNIAEGHSRFSPGDIVRFLSYAKASIDETADCMHTGLEAGYFSEEETAAVLGLIRRCNGAIVRWMDYLESPAARRWYEEFLARRCRGERRTPDKPPSRPTKRPGTPFE